MCTLSIPMIGSLQAAPMARMSGSFARMPTAPPISAACANAAMYSGL